MFLHSIPQAYAMAKVVINQHTHDKRYSRFAGMEHGFSGSGMEGCLSVLKSYQEIYPN